jgi:hypothetical protein
MAGMNPMAMGMGGQFNPYMMGMMNPQMGGMIQPQQGLPQPQAPGQAQVQQTGNVGNEGGGGEGGLLPFDSSKMKAGRMGHYGYLAGRGELPVHFIRRATDMRL